MDVVSPVKDGESSHVKKESAVTSNNIKEREKEGSFSTNSQLIPTQLFKVEEKIDIPIYDGVVDARSSDCWLEQLETNFTIYGCNTIHNVYIAVCCFTRLKLTKHTLIWWSTS